MYWLPATKLGFDEIDEACEAPPEGPHSAKSCRKQPVHWALVKRLVDIADVNRVDVQLFSNLCLGVAGFFRWVNYWWKTKRRWRRNELIRVGHIQFYPSRVNPEYLSLFLPFSKVDKYGLGITIVIPATPDHAYCPVRRMLAITADRHITEPLFTWPNGTVVTSASFIKMLRQHLRLLHIDCKQFSGHSLRRGAAVLQKHLVHLMNW